MESKIMTKQRYKDKNHRKLFLVALVVGHLWVTNLLVGVHDFLTLIWLLFSAYLIKDVVLEFQMGGRRLLANHFKPDSDAHKLITSPGFFSHVFAYLLAVLLMTGFFVTAIGIIKSHGLLAVTIMLAATTYVLFAGLMPAEEKVSAERQVLENPEGEKLSIEEVANSLEANALKYANFVMKLVLIIIVLNVTLSTVLSAHDTFKFATADITFANFDSAATANAVGYNGSNYYTRALLNAYIVADYFKLALANSLFAVFVGSDDKGSFFYVFYMFTLAFNLIKLVPFSIGFVLTARGYRQRSDDLLLTTTNFINRHTPMIKGHFEKLNSIVKSRIQQAKQKDLKEE